MQYDNLLLPDHILGNLKCIIKIRKEGYFPLPCLICVTFLGSLQTSRHLEIILFPCNLFFNGRLSCISAKVPVFLKIHGAEEIVRRSTRCQTSQLLERATYGEFLQYLLDGRATLELFVVAWFEITKFGASLRDEDGCLCNKL